MDVAQLRERWLSAYRELEQLDAKPQLTTKEDRRYAALNGQLDALETQIIEIERQKEKIAMTATNSRAVETTDPGFYVNVTSSHPLEDLRIGEPLADLRGRLHAALEADPYTPAHVAEGAVNIVDGVRGSKRAALLRCLATGSIEYRQAFAKLMRNELHLTTDTERQAVARAQSLTDAAGGFAVPFTLDPTLIGVTDNAQNPIRSMARNVNTSTDTWNGVTGTAVSFSFDAEAEQVSDDSITLAQPSIAVHRLAGFVPFSVEVGMDWADIESDLRLMLVEGKDAEEARAFLTGTGSGEPFGIQTALDGTASELAPAVAESFTAPDVYATQAALPARYRANAEWLLALGTSHDIRRFDTSGGGDFWTSLGGGTPERLLGWPVNIGGNVDDSNDINPAATADNFVLYAGDWSRYVVVTRIGMTIELVPHLMGANQRPTGQRGLFAMLRVGADSVDDNAFRVMSVPTTA